MIARDGRIAAVETVSVSLQAHPDLIVRGAKGAHDRSDFLLVRVSTAGGVEGYGEVSGTPLWSGEDASSAEHFIKSVLAPALVTKPLAPVGALESIMDSVLSANPFTKAGISTALWDAYAKAIGVPLAEALGGPYRYEVPIKLSLSGDEEQLDRAHEAAYRAGFRSFKVKVGLGIRGDVERVARARELVGPDTFLGADANGGWSRFEALQAIRDLADFGLAFIEQPVAEGDLRGMHELRARGLPVIADESVFDMRDLTRLAQEHAADVVSLYIGKSGGPGKALAMGLVADALGLSTVIGSNGELGIGAAAQLHLACALQHLSTGFPSDIIGAHYYAEDILEEPIGSDGVRVRLGTQPGLGVIPREDIRRRFR